MTITDIKEQYKLFFHNADIPSNDRCRNLDMICPPQWSSFCRTLKICNRENLRNEGEVRSWLVLTQVNETEEDHIKHEQLSELNVTLVT